jgi:hypothetical protein
MLITEITYFGQPCTVGCDLRCDKAWGISNRPRVEYDPDEPDDYAYLADGELGLAPANPGIYEGGHAKPERPPVRHNKWCVRECERSALVDRGAPIELPDFSRREFNIPSRHTDD